MKKTLNINLGGTVFHIDEDALGLLTEYLHDVKKQLGDDASAEEVMNDIEQRMGELFNEWMQGHREVVTKTDVQKVIDILGRPEQFEEEAPASEREASTSEGEATGGSKATEKEANKRGPANHRKLYRDPESAILGGVSTGLAKYLGVGVVLIRVIFFLLAWFGCSGILLYILCWIIIPEARTASQRLEMEGEDVNIDNIEKKVREEYAKTKDRVTDYVENSHIDQNARSFGYRIGRFLVVLVKAIAGLIAGIIGLTGFIILMVLLFVFFMLLTGGATFFTSFFDHWNYGFVPYNHLFMNTPALSLTTLGLIFVIGIPFLALFNLLFGRLLKLKPTPSWLNWLAIILWLVGLGTVIVSGVMCFTQYGGFWM